MYFAEMNNSTGPEVLNGSYFSVTADNVTCSNLTHPAEGQMDVDNSSSANSRYAFYYKIFVLVFGVFGNTLTIALMGRTKKPKTMKIILISLAISDNIYLLRHAPLMIYHKIFKTYFINTYRSLCKLWAISGFFLNNFSFILVAMLTVERCIAVAAPLKLKSHVTTKSTLAAVSILALVCLGVGLFVMVNTNLVNFYNKDGDLVRSSCDVVNYVQLILLGNLIIGHFIPGCVVVFGNILIWRFLRKHQSAMTNLNNTRSTASDSNFLWTAVSVSVALICLNFPMDFYFVFARYIFGRDVLSNPNNIYLTVALATRYTNYSINFYLYVAFAQSFRKEVWNFVRRLVTCTGKTLGQKNELRGTSNAESESVCGTKSNSASVATIKTEIARFEREVPAE